MRFISNAKLITIASVVTVSVIAGIVASIQLNETSPTIKHNSEQFDISGLYDVYTFASDKYGYIQEICIEYGGVWHEPMLLCGFTERVSALSFKANVLESDDTEITGINAKNMCRIIGIPCPEHPEFNGSYDIEERKYYSVYYTDDLRYSFFFEKDNDKTFGYTICPHGESFDDICRNWQMGEIVK